MRKDDKRIERIMNNMAVLNMGRLFNFFVSSQKFTSVCIIHWKAEKWKLETMYKLFLSGYVFC